MSPACRIDGGGFTIPTFDLVPRDVEGFMDELWEFQAAVHDCFTRSEPRAHFFDYMVGQLSPLERKSIEPMALRVARGTIRGLHRGLSVEFISIKSWVATGEDEPGMREDTAEVPHPIAAATCQRRLWSVTLRQRLPLRGTGSLRSRRWWSSWCAPCCSRVSSCRKSR